MKPIISNLRILWRADRMRAEARLQDVMRKASLFGIAALVGVFALGMLNAAAFFALAPSQGNAMAAFWVAAVNAVLGLALVVIANARPSRPELELIEEIRETALSNLEEEAAALQEQIAEVRREIVKVGHSVTSFSRDPLGSILSPSVILPAVKTVSRFLKDTKN